MTLQITSKAIDHSLVRIFGHSTLNKPHTADNISCVSRSCNEEKKKKREGLLSPELCKCLLCGAQEFYVLFGHKEVIVVCGGCMAGREQGV